MSTFRTESLGRRIARLRAGLRMTQQEVAARLAISRNAVSHMETGLSQPSERTVVLLAGLFRVEPHDLVAGTDYPAGKADRLPLVAPRYTEVEARLSTLDAELRWLPGLEPGALAAACATILAELHELGAGAAEPHERAAVRAAQRSVAALQARHGTATA